MKIKWFTSAYQLKRPEFPILSFPKKILTDLSESAMTWWSLWYIRQLNFIQGIKGITIPIVQCDFHFFGSQQRYFVSNYTTPSPWSYLVLLAFNVDWDSFWTDLNSLTTGVYWFYLMEFLISVVTCTLWFLCYSLVSTYVVCERLSVMHKQVSVY